MSGMALLQLRRTRSAVFRTGYYVTLIHGLSKFRNCWWITVIFMTKKSSTSPVRVWLATYILQNMFESCLTLVILSLYLFKCFFSLDHERVRGLSSAVVHAQTSVHKASDQQHILDIAVCLFAVLLRLTSLRILSSKSSGCQQSAAVVQQMGFHRHAVISPPQTRDECTVTGTF